MINLLRRLLARIRAEVPTYDVAPPVKDPHLLHVARKFENCPDARETDWSAIHHGRNRRPF